jgi:hypothetical protein
VKPAILLLTGIAFGLACAESETLDPRRPLGGGGMPDVSGVAGDSGAGGVTGAAGTAAAAGTTGAA